MSVPLRKSTPEKEITTADLAQGKRPSASEERPKPFLAEPDTKELEKMPRRMLTTPPRQLRCSPTTRLPTCEVAGTGFRQLLSTSPAEQSRKPMAWLPLR